MNYIIKVRTEKTDEIVTDVLLETWTPYTKDEVVNYIKDKTHSYEFYSKSPTWTTALVYVKYREDYWYYLTTDPDSLKRNNLLELPRF